MILSTPAGCSPCGSRASAPRAGGRRRRRGSTARWRASCCADWPEQRCGGAGPARRMAAAMPTALVTGATGFLGLNLVERLCAEGWEVRALVRPGADAARLRRFPVAAITEADVADPAAVARAFRAAPGGGGGPPDAVFHAAAVTSPWARRAALQARVNVDGTRTVARAALAAGAGRLVLTSSWSTYGLGRAEIAEDSARRGLRSPIAYVRTKALAEEEVRRAGVRRPRRPRHRWWPLPPSSSPSRGPRRRTSRCAAPGSPSRRCGGSDRAPPGRRGAGGRRGG
jgi:NAD dependent epimerase/dehydratase family